LRVFPTRDDLPDPYPFYAEMRRRHPVAHDEQRDVWAVFRHEDVRRVLSEWAVFSSDFERAPNRNRGRRLRRSLIGTDPPRHTKLRNLVSSAFTPRAIADLEPRIRALTHRLLDGVIEAGRMDLVQDLSYPLPVTVIAELLGVPAEDRARYKRWADRLVGANEDVFAEDREADERRQETLDEMDAYFRDVLAERRARPRGDLVSRLLEAEIDGERLSEEDLLAFCELLLLAGHVTTTNLLANAVRALLSPPERMERLRGDRTLLEPAIEEVLRHDSPVQGFVRFTAGDAEVGGRRIPAGRLVVAWIASANRDEARFPEADRFDLARRPNPHVAFGAGVHT
jgi:cytochrome P450